MWWLMLVVSILGLVSRPAGAEKWQFGHWVGIAQLGEIPVIQTRIDVYPECPEPDCAAYWQYEILFVDGRLFGGMWASSPPRCCTSGGSACKCTRPSSKGTASGSGSGGGSSPVCAS